VNWFKSALSQRLLKREQARCQTLYQEQAPRLFRRLLAKGYSKALAEEVIHEAFIVYWEKFHAPILRKETAPKSLDEPYTWLLRIAQNKAIDACRKATTAQNNQSHLGDTQQQVALPGNAFMERELLQQVLEQLGSRDVELLLLREVEGLSYDELAQKLSLERGSVGTLLRRARKAFQQAYHKLQNDSLTTEEQVR